MIRNADTCNLILNKVYQNCEQCAQDHKYRFSNCCLKECGTRMFCIGCVPFKNPIKHYKK